MVNFYPNGYGPSVEAPKMDLHAQMSMKTAERLRDTNQRVQEGECIMCHVEVCTHFDHLEKHPHTFYTEKYTHAEKEKWPP